MKIEIISGSPRSGSVTKRVALHLFQLLSGNKTFDVGMIDMHNAHLPPVQEVWQKPENVPLFLRKVAGRVFEADAFILVSPEYNGSYSPALKNFLDHFPKQEKKVFGVVTASPGSLGGIRAAMQMQNLIFGLFGIGAPKMLVVPEVDRKFSEDGKLLDTTFARSVESFANDFLWLANAVHDATLVTRARRVA